jgi:cell wall-associated NlpC family hydrolase
LIGTATPPGLNTVEVERLLEEASHANGISERIVRISARFLGRPYFDNPLEGGPHSPEVFKLSLEGFDCVTYMETVLALARSRSPDEFIDEVREMRYAGGLVEWRHRNHYMVDWVSNNEGRGIIKDMTVGPESVAKTRTLSLIEALPAKTVSFRCFPKRSLKRIQNRIEPGDMMLFASVRKMLDVFHAGILIKGGGEISLRHATRSAGRVVEQSLASFAAAHRMSGMILLRPL